MIGRVLVLKEKPVIRLAWFGTWICVGIKKRLFIFPEVVTAYGTSPMQAYEFWIKQ